MTGTAAGDSEPLYGFDRRPLPVVPPAVLAEIVRRHRIPPSRIRRQPWSGAMNTIYEIGDELMLRIPMDVPEATRCILEEAVVLPVLERHSIVAPRLVAVDETCDLLEVPYTIYRRLDGLSMDWWEASNDPSPELYRAIGRQLATLHLRVTEVPVDERRLATPYRRDPDEVLGIERLPRDARMWIEAVFDRLRPAVTIEPSGRRFLHAEVRPGNVVVANDRLAGLIDWGSAGWGDPALEFHALWVWAVPHALAGYREVAPLDGDSSAEARILWDHLARVLALEGAIDVLRGVDWVLRSADGTPPWIRELLPGPLPPW